MSERCDNCRFWSWHGKGEMTGDCRRFPPALPNHPGQEIEGVFDGVFPTTGQSEWCGEWKPKGGEPKAADATLLGQPLKELGLSVRAYKGVWRVATKRWTADGSHLHAFFPEEAVRLTVAHLTDMTAAELMAARGFGYACLVEVREKLRARGLALRGDPPGSSPGGV